MPDDSQTRNAPTTPAPPPSDSAPITQRPSPEFDQAYSATMLPQQRPLALDENRMIIEPESMPELLYNELMKAHQRRQQDNIDLLDPEGKFEQNQRARDRGLLRDFTQATKDAAREALEASGIKELSHELGALADAVRHNDVARDAEIKELHERMSALRDEFMTAVGKLASKIEHIEKHTFVRVPPTV